MTCIVAIEKGNGFVIGTDSIAVDANNEVDIVDGPKWHIAEDYVAAWCGSFSGPPCTFAGQIGRAHV